MLIVIKAARVVTYLEELPLIDLLDQSMKKPCEVKWQIKYITSTLTEDLWTPT